MNIYHESGFAFDFSAAVGSVVHDKDAPHDGNTFWPGVDFRVLETDGQVWIEVKSWSFKTIIDKIERQQAKKDFAAKMIARSADEFRDDIVAKFLGTTCYLYWSGLELPQRVNYIVFLEPPDRGSRALLGPFQDRLRNQFKSAQARPWGRRIQYRVVDLAEFQKAFPKYPVTRL
jgi:hypothetical protein